MIYVSLFGSEAKDIAGGVTGLGSSILTHFVKLLAFDDPINTVYHCDDIDTWIFDISDAVIGCKSGVSLFKLRKWMFDDNVFGAKVHVNNTVEQFVVKKLLSRLKKYSSLKKLRTSEEIAACLIEIFSQEFFRKISTGSFTSTKEYLENLHML